MIELSLAYIFAAVVIGGLLVFARRNQQQGWRKERGSWLERQSAAALETFGVQAQPTAPTPGGPHQHLADLARLQQALEEEGVSVRPERAAEQEKEQLVRSR